MKKRNIIILLLSIFFISIASKCEMEEYGYGFKIVNNSSYDVVKFRLTKSSLDPDVSGSSTDLVIEPGEQGAINILLSSFREGYYKVEVFTDFDLNKGWFWETSGHYVYLYEARTATITVEDANATLQTTDGQDVTPSAVDPS